jgi:LmbE family N-acetylglucosaminyl deacetylase
VLKKLLKFWRRCVQKPGFSRTYLLVSLATLLLTTLFWAIKSANLQLANADQLIDPYLFQNWHTFHNAVFPDAHTFLLKWPLFLLIKSLNYSAAAFTSVTLLAVLVTIGLFVAVIYKIEKRPLVFGTICLALASSLLLVPPQPYLGGLLPVNMGMLASRNLEYVLFLISVGLFVRRPRLRSPTTWLSIVCLSLLVASDRLFLTLSVGGALLGLAAYALVRSWQLVTLFSTWLVVSLFSGIGGGAILWLLSHFTKLAGNDQPYALTFSSHSTVLGAIYGALGLATNLGANPAYSATIVTNIPGRFLDNMLGLGGPAYLINLLILASGLYAAWRLSNSVLLHHRRNGKRLADAYKMAAVLIWSTVAAVLAFAFTDHYYAVDARYLGLGLFTVFIVLAAYMRRVSWPSEVVAGAGLIIFIGILLGLPAANHSLNLHEQALSGVNQRNALVADAANQHRSPVLIGDYWRVLPIKQAAGNKLNIMPLDNCTSPRQGLTSRAWNKSLKNTGFAYLLSSDKSLTSYPSCSLKQVVAAYGRPNASVVTSGKLSQPNDTVLFYDRGINKNPPNTRTADHSPATVSPIAPEELPYTSCRVPTIVNIVAHQDDDLLFMNPDVIHDIRAGHCVRTIYVTAGDAGGNSFYWLGREQGSEAAYSYMTNSKEVWIQRIVKLGTNQYAVVSNPRGNPRISLIFLRLPDGNVKGQGFAAERHESLANLEAGRSKTMSSVDGQSVYDSQQLTDSLVTFMQLFGPAELRTQSNFNDSRYQDHSDHMAVGRYAQKAYQQYENQQFENKVAIPLKFYVGYPIHQFSANIPADDLADKQAAFFAYGQYDSGVCNVMVLCKKMSYGAYLERQYQNPY